MRLKELLKEDNAGVAERYDLALSRICQIPGEKTVPADYRSFFESAAELILQIAQIAALIQDDAYDALPLDIKKAYNKRLYRDIRPGHYEESYANPVYASECFGKKFGEVFSFLMAEIRTMIRPAYEGRMLDLTICMELFIEIYNAFESEELPSAKSIRDMIYWYVSDYSDIWMDYDMRASYDPGYDFIYHIVMDSDLSNEAYLYAYGDYIGSPEQKTAGLLNQKTEDEINDLAEAIVGSFLKKHGYETGNEDSETALNSHRKTPDISIGRTVTIDFPVGCERVTRAAVHILEVHGFQVIMRRVNVTEVNRHARTAGVNGVSPNPQYDTDHSHDGDFYSNKAYIERRASALRVLREKYRDLIELHEGVLAYI